jgi:hypothetical protein
VLTSPSRTVYDVLASDCINFKCFTLYFHYPKTSRDFKYVVDVWNSLCVLEQCHHVSVYIRVFTSRLFQYVANYVAGVRVISKTSFTNQCRCAGMANITIADYS